MENTRKFWRTIGIGAILASIGLGMAACDTGGGGAAAGNADGANAPGFMGETMTLSGQVWTWAQVGGSSMPVSWSGTTGVFASFYGWDEDFAVTGGSGAVINGQLNFSIGTPPNLHLGLRSFFVGWQYEHPFDNFQISDEQVRFQLFQGLSTMCGGYLWREIDPRLGDEEVVYIFVDRNVTITGTGRTFLVPCSCHACNCVQCNCTYVTRTQNLNLSLRRGWNAIYQRVIEHTAGAGVRMVNVTIGAGDPDHARWWFFEW